MFVESKVIGEIKFGEWIDFGHKDTIYQLKFGWLKFGESRRLAKFAKLSRRQTFPLYGMLKYAKVAPHIYYASLLRWQD